MRLIAQVTDMIMLAASLGDKATVYNLIDATIRERTEAMHERAQRAEGRAIKAERTADHIARRVGRMPLEP